MRLREGFYEFLLILHHGQNHSPKFLCGHPNPPCVRMRLCLKTGCFLKRRSRLNEVAGWTLIQSDWCPYRKRLAHRHTEGRAGEDPGRGRPSAGRGARPRRAPACRRLTLDFQLLEWRESKRLSFKPPVGGVLLWRPQQTHRCRGQLLTTGSVYVEIQICSFFLTMRGRVLPKLTFPPEAVVGPQRTGRHPRPASLTAASAPKDRAANPATLGTEIL